MKTIKATTLLLVVIALSACGARKETSVVNEDQYPVVTEYGPQTRPYYCGDLDITGAVCTEAFVSYFTNVSISYYYGPSSRSESWTDDIFNECSVLAEFYQIEECVRSSF